MFKGANSIYTKIRHSNESRQKDRKATGCKCNQGYKDLVSNLKQGFTFRINQEIFCSDGFVFRGKPSEKNNSYPILNPWDFVFVYKLSYSLE